MIGSTKGSVYCYELDKNKLARDGPVFCGCGFCLEFWAGGSRGGRARILHPHRNDGGGVPEEQAQAEPRHLVYL
ncbi:hypothetical protein SDC9_192836 [bioreactor metagenome]|uniref:Uncharacterized protein n=1 Tax=bioreactor metagenome TaxID=1076179 RepID=A0A645I488_9ZZZZ